MQIESPHLAAAAGLEIFAQISEKRAGITRLQGAWVRYRCEYRKAHIMLISVLICGLRLFACRRWASAVLLLCILGKAIGMAAADQDHVHFDPQGAAIDLAAWHPDYRERCYFSHEQSPTNAGKKTIEQLISLLRQEQELADYLLDKASRQKTIFCLDERADGTRGYYDYRYNLIALRESLPLQHKLIIFVHELRHIDNLSRGYGHSLEYDIDEMVRLTYAVEADVQAITALYAWRMWLRGVEEPWQALLQMPCYADIAYAFATEMEVGGDEASAVLAAFRQWYHSHWRIDNYQRSCYMGYLDLLDDTKRIRKYALLPGNFFDQLCILPDGSNYGCHLTPEIQRHR